MSTIQTTWHEKPTTSGYQDARIIISYIVSDVCGDNLYIFCSPCPPCMQAYKVQEKQKVSFPTPYCFVCLGGRWIDCATLVFPLRLPRRRYQASLRNKLLRNIFCPPCPHCMQAYKVQEKQKVSFPTPYCFVCLGGRWDSNPRP